MFRRSCPCRYLPIYRMGRPPARSLLVRDRAAPRSGTGSHQRDGNNSPVQGKEYTRDNVGTKLIVSKLTSEGERSLANVYKPGLVQVRPRYTQSDVSAHIPENVLWFQNGSTTTPTLANLQGIAAQFDPLWGAVFAAYGPSVNKYTGSVVTDWSSNTGLAYNSVGVFTPVAGGQAAGCQSSQVAILVSYQIGVRYKGGHPRTYLPYVSEGVTQGSSGDQVTSTCQTAIVNAYNAMISGMKGSATLSGQTMVIYRHRTNAALAQTYPFATFSVNAQTATQRRRVRRVAHH